MTHLSRPNVRWPCPFATHVLTSLARFSCDFSCIHLHFFHRNESNILLLSVCSGILLFFPPRSTILRKLPGAHRYSIVKDTYKCSHSYCYPSLCPFKFRKVFLFTKRHPPYGHSVKSNWTHNWYQDILKSFLRFVCVIFRQFRLLRFPSSFSHLKALLMAYSTRAPSFVVLCRMVSRCFIMFLEKKLCDHVNLCLHRQLFYAHRVLPVPFFPGPV